MSSRAAERVGNAVVTAVGLAACGFGLHHTVLRPPTVTVTERFAMRALCPEHCGASCECPVRDFGLRVNVRGGLAHQGTKTALAQEVIARSNQRLVREPSLCSPVLTADPSRAPGMTSDSSSEELQGIRDAVVKACKEYGIPCEVRGETARLWYSERGCP